MQILQWQTFRAWTGSEPINHTSVTLTRTDTFIRMWVNVVLSKWIFYLSHFPFKIPFTTFYLFVLLFFFFSLSLALYFADPRSQREFWHGSSLQPFPLGGGLSEIWSECLTVHGLFTGLIFSMSSSARKCLIDTLQPDAGTTEGSRLYEALLKLKQMSFHGQK